MNRFDQITDDLLQRPEIRRLALRRNHHFTENRLRHVVRTAHLSFWLARVLRADVRVATRAGLLHDWFFERREQHLNKVGADVHHYRIAAANVRGIGEPRAVVEAVASHMWPWGDRPRSVEAWIVWSADNLVWVWDALVSAQALVRRKIHGFLYGPPFSRLEPYAA